jgi:hypothetical protein
VTRNAPPENLVGRWKKTGVGVHHEGGRVWITQLFCR